MSELTYGSLFAGYGGLDLGAQSVLPGRLAWFAEFDKAPSRILAHHYPDVPNLGDVTKVDWTQVEPVDVITGGSPCQDLSHAGKRKGMTDGTRSNLWAEMREAIAVIRPRLVVWENVRGALSAPADSAMEPCPGCVGDPRERGPVLRALGRVVGDLAELGYDCRWYGLRAADVGGAHGRFRIFLFATPADADDAGWGEYGRAVAVRAQQPAAQRAGDDAPDLTLLPTPAVNDMGAAYTPETWDAWTERMKAAHGNGNGHGKSLSIEALRLLPTPRATDGTKGGPNQRGSSGDLMLPSAVHLLPTPQAADGNGGGRRSSPGHATTLPGEVLDKLLPTPTTTQRGPDANLDTREGARANLHNEVQKLLPTPTSQAAKHAGGDTDRGAGSPDDANLWIIAQRQDWREYGPAIARAERALGRPAPSPTEPGAKGQPRLSPAFVEWMMMLPEGWVTDVPGVTRNEQLKALGNGVVPPQAAAATLAFVQDTCGVAQPSTAPDEVEHLLPTPRALDSTGVRGVTVNRTTEANARAGLTLTDVLVEGLGHA